MIRGYVICEFTDRVGGSIPPYNKVSIYRVIPICGCFDFLGSKSIAFELSINTGTKKSDTNTAATVPEIRATPNPPKTGSLASKADPRMIATAVSKIGLALVADATAIACRFCIACSNINDLAKSIKSREFLELIPINAMNPISEVAVKKKVSLVKKLATQ